MKGFFSWFNSKSKMKRWIFTILAGIILACYGVSEVLVLQEVSFLEVGKIIVLFVLGFTMIIVGLIYSQKRVLEILIESTDYRMDNGSRNINAKSLIFNKKVYNEGPNIVVIGGGSGLNTVLKGLKNYTSNITAIVTVSGYGKELDEGKKALNLLPLEDIKDSIISLAENEEQMQRLLNEHINIRPFEKLEFSDIYFKVMNDIYGNFSDSIVASSDLLKMTGKVLPVTLNEMQICAELNDGTIIDEKDKIPEIVSDKVAKINRIYINPSNCVPAPGVLDAISNADAIIIGPGSLYTNVIPNLLVKNVSKTIKNSKAIKIYVSNIMTEPGQTDNYSLSEHIKSIIDHAGANIIDYCIYDSGEIIPEFIKIYNKNGQDIVEPDIQKAKELGVKLLEKNLSYIIDDNIRHNPNAVAESVIEIICDDLKYKDKQDDPKYVMLKTKLREQKKSDKQKKKNEKKTDDTVTIKEKQPKQKHLARKSKFNEKYKERIKSIKESDHMIDKRRAEAIEKIEKEQFLKQFKNNSDK